MFPISLERHAVPRGDSFTNIRVVIPVERDQIDFLALGDVLSEMVEPLHSGIARYYFWRHVLSKPVATGVVQTSVAARRVSATRIAYGSRTRFEVSWCATRPPNEGLDWRNLTLYRSI